MRLRQHDLHLRTQLGRLNEGAGFLDCHVLDIREPVISHLIVCGAAIHTHSTGYRRPELYAEGKSGAEAAEVGRSHISESLNGQPSRIRCPQPLLLPFWCCLWNSGLLPCYVLCTWVFIGVPGSHRSSGRNDKVRPQVKGADVLGVGWKGQPEVRPAEEAVLASRAEVPVHTCCVTLSLGCGSSYLSQCEARRR